MKTSLGLLLVAVGVVFAGGLDDNGFYMQLKSDAQAVFLSLNTVFYVRIGAVLNSAVFDATAPYHATAVGMYSNVPRRPEVERTTRNKNIAISYAYLRVLSALIPGSKAFFVSQLTSIGLDPNDASTDLTTPIGIGNYAAQAVLTVRNEDGWNQFGDATGNVYNKDRYESTVFYRPKNSPFKINNPNAWQPNVDLTAYGLFTCQVHLSPQYSSVKPFSMFSVNSHNSPPPLKSDIANFVGYVSQIQEILNTSYSLNDYKKMTAEFFNEKPNSMGKTFDAISKLKNLDLEEYVMLLTAATIAMHDAGILAWKEKLKYDAIRPISVVKYLYENETIKAWGGPGKGPVDNMLGKEWAPYIRTPPHSDYPSGSACFCSAFSQVLRNHFKSDVLNVSFTHKQGSSKIEPGLTPASDLTITYDTLTDFVNSCLASRFYAGIHFMDACKEGARLCQDVGDYAYSYVKTLSTGGTRGGCRAPI